MNKMEKKIVSCSEEYILNAMQVWQTSFGDF